MFDLMPGHRKYNDSGVRGVGGEAETAGGGDTAERVRGPLADGAKDRLARHDVHSGGGGGGLRILERLIGGNKTCVLGTDRTGPHAHSSSILRMDCGGDGMPRCVAIRLYDLYQEPGVKGDRGRSAESEAI